MIKVVLPTPSATTVELWIAWPKAFFGSSGKHTQMLILSQRVLPQPYR